MTTVSERRAISTREKLILTGETLFGEFGFDAVSYRSIMAAAKQRNSNVVRYHFGDRLGLLDAIFEYRAGQIAPVRWEMIREAREHGQLDDVKGLLRCIVVPELEIFRRDGTLNYLRLTIYYMLYLRPKGVAHPYDRNSTATSSLHEVMRLLSQRVRYLPEGRFSFRAYIVATALTFAVINLNQSGMTRGDIDALTSDTIDMMAAALCSPPWLLQSSYS